jgi:hypothetical protein
MVSESLPDLSESVLGKRTKLLKAYLFFSSNQKGLCNPAAIEYKQIYKTAPM